MISTHAVRGGGREASMGYHLGVDLGTTFTAAAALNSDTPRGNPVMLGLGTHALQIPSVLYFQDSGVLVGEPAELRSGSDPARTAREFKRRIGDPVPVMVGGRSYSAQALSAKVLRWVVDRATEELGEPPLDITLAHPANWAHFKIDLLRQVAVLAEVAPVFACSEPQAAALQYASKASVNVGDAIAVYDLGGGTFDICIMEKTDGGFRILGRPEGVEHLGGIDFDEAVFRRVIDQLPPDAFDAESDDDAGQLIALSRLRRDCAEAKEALSTDVEAFIPVALPRSRTSVTLTRGEFEEIIRPSLQDTIGATRRALRSAGIGAERLTAMVLVGGSSRIPLVAEMLRAEFNCPIAVDTHPKYDVAMGAARAAVVQDAAIPLVSRPPSPASLTSPSPSPGSLPLPLPGSLPSPLQGSLSSSSSPLPSSHLPSPTPPGTEPGSAETVAGHAALVGSGSGSGSGSGPGPSAEAGQTPGSRQRPSGRGRLIAVVGAATVLVLAVTAVVLVLRSGSTTDAGAGSSTTSSAPGTESAASPSSTATATVSAIGLPASNPLPDGQLVVARTVAGAVDLSVIDTGSGTLLAMLAAGPNEDRAPAISPDRSTIIYADQTDTTRSLRVMAANGAGDRPLFSTPPAGCTRVNGLAWNPRQTGELALVCLDEQGKQTLQIIGVDGRQVRTLDPGMPRVGDLSYSPDGSLLTFWASEPSFFDGGSIYRMPADGSAPPVALTTEKVGTDANPVFSPDGSEIAFRRRQPGSTSQGNLDIFVIGVDGRNLRQLTNSLANDEEPSWSPDATQIAFASAQVAAGAVGPSRLWIMNSDGSDQRQLLADDTAQESAPAWSPR